MTLSNVPRLHEARGELLGPPLLGLDVLSVEQLSRALSFVTSDDDADAATLEVACSEGTDAAEASGAEIDGVGGGLREVGRSRPVDGEGEDLLAERASQGAGDRPEVGT